MEGLVRVRSVAAWMLVWAATSLAGPTGCASSGHRFDVDTVARIQRGVTQREQVRAWFGAPTSVQSWQSGSRWGYFFEETTEADTGFLRKVWRAVSAWFGWPFFPSPVDVEFKHTVRHELDVYFSPDGTVEDYVYERETIPSRRVY